MRRAQVEMVVIGVSLGGLSALTTVLSALPATLRPPLAIVQHRSADADSRLAGLLSRTTQLPVKEPMDKEKIEQGHVYVAPADYHLMIDRGHFALSVDEPVIFARPAIDVLFESAAEAYGAACLGVLMTGASEDGAAGLHHIATRGGLTMIQDPATAESPVSPMAALARMKPDYVLPLEVMGAAIAGFCAP